MLPGRDLPPKAKAAPKGTAAPKGVAAPKGLAAGREPARPSFFERPDVPSPPERAENVEVAVAPSPPRPQQQSVPARPTPPPQQAPPQKPQAQVPAPVQVRKGGCLRLFVAGWGVLFGLGLLGSLADFVTGGDDDDGASPATTVATADAAGVSGETLTVGRYTLTATASFALEVPELGRSGYLVVDVRVDGEGPLLPLARFGFSLVAPDGTTLQDPFRPADGRLVWDIGGRRGEFQIVWESPEITDDGTATWSVLLL